ncbi:type II toxin-antitoxin system RelB/DinJ family antitoxin [Candidatus Peregrinibacteria bacterium]|nr:type II toxin-antitoxin system RelB/DinJ family antitoxin [Candidatus Peregrinibacteria bacterium]
MNTLTLKIESDLKKKAQKIADNIGLSLSALIKILLKNTIRTGRIDIATKSRYDGSPKSGDLVFKDLKESIAYFKKLADEDGDMA